MSEVAERLAANVVTSENLAEFNAKRMGLADPSPSEAVALTEPQEVDQGQSEPAEVENEATATEDRKQNPKLERRFSEITKQRESAREEARRERQAREDLETKVRDLEAKIQPKAEPVAETEPLPEQFSDMYEYAKALTDYRVEQRLTEEKQKEVQAKVAAEHAKLIDTWGQRVKEAKAEMPDFDDMINSTDVTVSNEVRDAIFESEVGPRILYHLAENPDFAVKLQGMTLTAALKAIGKLEGQYEKTDPQTKPVVGKSKAPAPINPIRSAANGRDVNLTSDGQFHGSYQAWRAARLAGKIR
jgi:hypothetical protein